MNFKSIFKQAVSATKFAFIFALIAVIVGRIFKVSETDWYFWYVVLMGGISFSVYKNIYQPSRREKSDE